MANDGKKDKKTVLLEKPELYNLRLLFGLNMFLLIALFVMPQYFGIHIIWDITCSRVANILITIYALVNRKVLYIFIKTALRCPIKIPLLLYLVVTFYTMVLRVDINSFMLPFLEILTFFMLMFAIRYVIGINRAFRTIIGCAYFLSIYGLIEFATGISFYQKFLKTIPASVANSVRSGYYRIMGPCGHALGYGLLLLLFIPIVCVDYKKNKVFLYKRPFLMILLLANVFLTGSRSSLALAAIEVLFITFISDKEQRKKSIYFTVGIFIFFVFLLVVFYKTRIANYIIMQIAILFDTVFDTQLSVQFGAEVNRLKDSENYRSFLPYIFTLDWLNPLLGRGVKRGFAGKVTNSAGQTATIKSVDNYYICQYIKYAYPGLFAYVSYIIISIKEMIKGLFRYRYQPIKVLLIGFICYYVNLWWVDALQTLKFVYAYAALFFAIILYYKDIDKKEEA